MEIEILVEGRLRYWCGQIDLPAAAVDVLAGIAGEVRKNEAMRRIFSEFHEKTVLRGEWHRLWSPLPFHKDVLSTFGERASLFYLLAYLSALPVAAAEYTRRGIGMDIFRATMSDVRVWLVHRYDLDGRWRFDQFSWVWRHLSCELFRLGRLQFMLKTFDDGVTAYRSKEDGHYLLLADPNVTLRGDGCALGAGRSLPDEPFYQPHTSPDPGEEWLPAFEPHRDGWRGHPILASGRVQRKSAFLRRSEWEQVLVKGDTVLDFHIPRKDRFNVEDCRESLRQAYDFFAKQYPSRPFKAGYCHTWFFSPQLADLLPPESNILRFQREFYLYPFPGTPGFLWDYVFGEKVKRMGDAPRDTALRRAVLDWLESGKEIFDLAGVMFHGPEAWGSQPYPH